MASEFGLRLGAIAASVHDSSPYRLVMHNAELLLFTELPQRLGVMIVIARTVNSLGTAASCILFHAYKESVGYWWRGVRYDATIGGGVLDVSKKIRAVSNAEIETTMTDLFQGVPTGSLWDT